MNLFLANSGDYVEVFINGKYAGRAETDLYSVTPFTTVYEPGEIRIVAYKDGKPWAEHTSKTACEPAAVRLEMENLTLAADGDDAAIISAYLVDKDGNICVQETGRMLHFSSNEAGEFICAATVREDGLADADGALSRG